MSRNSNKVLQIIRQVKQETFKLFVSNVYPFQIQVLLLYYNCQHRALANNIWRKVTRSIKPEYSSGLRVSGASCPSCLSLFKFGYMLPATIGGRRWGIWSPSICSWKGWECEVRFTQLRLFIEYSHWLFGVRAAAVNKSVLNEPVCPYLPSTPNSARSMTCNEITTKSFSQSALSQKMAKVLKQGANAAVLR